jgi:replicative DNA helicase
VSWDDFAGRVGTASGFLASGYLSQPSPVPTCIAPLDEALGGGLRPGLSVLGGEPGAGKSALALTVALLTAWRGANALYVSLEMGEGQCWGRLASALSALPEYGGAPFRWADAWGWARRSREARDEARGRGEEAEAVAALASGGDPAASALGGLSRLPGGLAVSTALAAHSLAGLDSLVCEAAAAGASLVVVDYAQLVQTTPGAAEYDRVTAVSGTLNATASERGVPVLALSSLARAKDREGPGLHSFRGSGQLEYDANAAMVLRREGEDAPGGARPLSLHVLKNRWGAVTGEGGIPLSLDGAHSLVTWPRA